MISAKLREKILNLKQYNTNKYHYFVNKYEWSYGEQKLGSKIYIFRCPMSSYEADRIWVGMELIEVIDI